MRRIPRRIIWLSDQQRPPGNVACSPKQASETRPPSANRRSVQFFPSARWGVSTMDEAPGSKE